MRIDAGTWKKFICVLFFLPVVIGCTFSSNLTFHNRTYTPLTPYPVNLELDSPRRQADTANTVASGGMQSINPHWLNPVYYATGITDESRANGIFIGLNLEDAEQLQIQYKLFHYRVPPGDAGADPDLQPILIEQDIVDVEDVDMIIGVVGRLEGDPWRVRIVPD